MKTSAIAAILSLSTGALAACGREGSFLLTFFGYPDNTPASNQVAYNCGGRNYVAGGSGTYDDPLTMASAAGEFSQCEIVYIPYLQKYVRYEDDCEKCTEQYNDNGQRHMDIWTGDEAYPDENGGQDQLNCEDALTPDGEVVIVTSPDSTYQVDSTPLYHVGASNPCRTNHVYPDATAHTYCSS